MNTALAKLIAGFFTYMTLAEGKDMDAVKAKWNAVSGSLERTRLDG